MCDTHNAVLQLRDDDDKDSEQKHIQQFEYEGNPVHEVWMTT
jgi:hypothetical protein